MNRQRALIILVIALALATAGFAYANRVSIAEYFRTAALQPPLPPAVSFEDVKPEPPDTAEPTPTPNPTPQPTPEPEDEPEPSALPASFNLAVPFTTQAPFGNWDDVHEETCEEAAILMVDAFYDGKTSLDQNAVEAELQKMVQFEKDLFGYFEDTTAAETATLAKKYFGYATVKLIKDPTVEDIKNEVRAGHPVVVPAQGQQLGNPFFTPPGPIYHMFVIRGWTKDGKFITNDPGTRRGEGYVYEEDVIMNAMHDWVHSAHAAVGPKVVIVIYPNP